MSAIQAGLTPEETAAAKTCVMHFLSCALAGRALPWSQQAVRLARPAAGGATAIGRLEPVVVEDAVFANAVLGQSTLAEDVHVPSLAHPGSIVIPAALAAAEEREASGATFLAGVVAGYDVLCNVGLVLKTPEFVDRGFRPSGIFGPLGAAAAVSLVDGLRGNAVGSALAIAANTAAGLREWANAGSTDIYAHNGFAARNGFQSARLAGAGFDGPASVFEGPAGMGRAFSGDSVDWASMGRSLDETPAVCTVQFKRFPACSAVQTVLALAARTAAGHDLDPDAIRAVTVHTHRHGKRNPGCDSTGPWQSIGQAQMSNQLGVALALSGRPLEIDAYSGYADERIADLARRVEVVEVPEFTRRYPGRASARLMVELRSGEVIDEEQDEETPLSAEEVREHLEVVLRASVRDDVARRVVGALEALEDQASTAALAASFRVPSTGDRAYERVSA
jgi:2-methylcitrate dehydratase PrpD